VLQQNADTSKAFDADIEF